MELSSIRVQFIQPIINYHPKLLKMQLQSTSLIKTTHPAIIINQHNITWKGQILTLPHHAIHQLIPFQIYNSYNPNHSIHDITDVISGHLLITNSQHQKKVQMKWDICKQNQKIGDLYAYVQLNKTPVQLNRTLLNNSSSSLKRSSSSLNKSICLVNNSSHFFGKTIETRSNSICITSLYAYGHPLNPAEKIRAFLSFQLGDFQSPEDIQRSQIKRILQHQYRSNQKIIIDIPDSSQNKSDILTVSFNLFDPKINHATALAKGKTKLLINRSSNPTSQQNSNPMQTQNQIKLERIFLYDQQNQQVGWVSFKYIQVYGENINPTLFLQDQFNTIGDINFRPLNNQMATISQTPNHLTLMSPLNSNTKVYIPKADRFFKFQKNVKCDQIGLAHQSIDLKDHPSHHTYKVASIGFGKRISKVVRDQQIPGVGRYKLPSIFDKY